MKMVEIKNQNFIFLGGVNFVGVDFLIARIVKIMIDAPRATTPPSLEGMDRRTT